MAVNTPSEEMPPKSSLRKETLWNRDYCKAMVGNFMLFFSFYILTPLLPIYLDAEFAADKDVMGLVLSGYVVAALLVRPFSGFIVDSFDRKRCWQSVSSYSSSYLQDTSVPGRYSCSP